MFASKNPDQEALGLTGWSLDYKLQRFNLKPSFGFAATGTCFRILSLSGLTFQIPLCIFMVRFFLTVCVLLGLELVVSFDAPPFPLEQDSIIVNYQMDFFPKVFFHVLLVQ